MLDASTACVRVLLAIALSGDALSCGEPNDAAVGTTSSVRSYLEDRAVRRAELVASLTTADNDYAADPTRLDAGFERALHRAGPVPGHAFGLDLDPSSRDALLAFLAAL